MDAVYIAKIAMAAKTIMMPNEAVEKLSHAEIHLEYKGADVHWGAPHSKGF